MSVPPIVIKVEKNSKGYNWELRVSGEDEVQVLSRLDRLTAQMKSRYGSPEF